MVKDNLPKPEDWHELAQRIQEETDPEKMIELVRELIARFDEERLRKSLWWIGRRKAAGVVLNLNLDGARQDRLQRCASSLQVVT